MSAAKHDGHAVCALRGDEVIHLVGKGPLRGFEVVVLGGDGAGVDKRALVMNSEGAECGAQRVGALGGALAAAVALNAFVGGKADEVHGSFLWFGVGGDLAVPAGVLGAGAVVAAGPVGCGCEKWCCDCIHATRA